MTATARADYTALLWEQEEATREAASVKADRLRSLLALAPHLFKAAASLPGFCECGWAKNAGIHQ